MAVQVTSLVFAKIGAEQKGLTPPDSTRAAVVGSLLPNPVLALVVGQSLATTELARRPAAVAAPPQAPLFVLPARPPEPEPEPEPEPVEEPSPGEILNRVDSTLQVAEEARDQAGLAREEAASARAAVADLKTVTTTGFERIEAKLGGSEIAGSERPPSKRKG